MMSCNIPPEVEEYLKLVEEDSPRFCAEQHALAAYVRKVFAEEDIHVETERLTKYLGLAKYFPFKALLPWEKFIVALWLCTYRADGLPRWSKLLAMIARGAGKDGLIAFSSMALSSPFNPVGNYDVDICANCEDQAVRPVKDLVDVLERQGQSAKLIKHFYHTKELVRGRRNGGTVQGHTSNAKTKDGLRSGCIILNEVHQYQNYDIITVFTTGLGKHADFRTGIFTSNGNVNDGPLDDYLAQGERILFEGERDNGFLPFICRLPNIEAVKDRENWYMANPSLMYFPHLLEATAEQYIDWTEHPERNPDFLPKRMGIRAGFSEIAVTSREKIVATKKPLPDVSRWNCTVGIDYAELNDWASVVYHFRRGNDRYDICHTWVCLQSKTLGRVKAPWQDWINDGHLTMVDDVSISPELLAEDIREMGKIVNIKMLAMDHFRWTLMSDALKKIGFDANDKTRVKLIRPSDIMIVEPVIQECFDREYYHWGDCPTLRWATSNTKRVASSKKIGTDTGNFIFAKIEAKSRKTDPFMALVAAQIIEPVLGAGKATKIPTIGAIRL